MTQRDQLKILLIKPLLPYPPNQGTKIASFGLIKSLSHEFDVTVLARLLSRDEEAHVRALEQWCSRVVTVLAPNKRSIVHRAAYKLFYSLKSTLLRRSLKRLYDCPGALVAAAKKLRGEHFDLVIVEYWQLARLLSVFDDKTCVLLTHDIDMLVNQRIALLERNLFRKIQAVRRWLLERKEELAAYRSASRIWTLTDRDRSQVKAICGSDRSVEVLPLGFDLDHLGPPGMLRNRGEVLFMGVMSAAFNQDALEYLVRNIYPHLEGIDGLSLTIVGGALPAEMRAFGLRPEVEVVGRVADVRPYLHRASCLVVPLRFGGGLRIRILEAMAAGLPVVCSTVAVAGMPFEAGKEYLLADSPEAFGEQIKRLLSNGELARSLAAAALAKTRQEYAAERQSARARELVRGLVDTS